jgi:hypothetical protein
MSVPMRFSLTKVPLMLACMTVPIDRSDIPTFPL